MNYLFFISLSYILSCNSFFIKIFGFSFNPSKLFIIIVIPFYLISRLGKMHVYREDILFLVFICWFFIKSLYWQDLFELTKISNWIIPYLYMKVISSEIPFKRIKTLASVILLFSLCHSIVGLTQFYSGDPALLFFDEVQMYKVMYAQEFSFNPFDSLSLLPHGFYQYSTLLAMSLVFPLYLVFCFSSNKLIFIACFSMLALVIFLCFSRFEIISIVIAFVIMNISHRSGNLSIKHFIMIFMFTFVFVILYMLNTADQLGTVEARLISGKLISIVFDNFDKVIFGYPSVSTFRQLSGEDVPHNMFFYVFMSNGLVGAIALLLFFYMSLSKVFSNQLSISDKNIFEKRLYLAVLAFLMYTFSLKSFDYYLFDGYSSIFLVFYSLSILNLIKFNNVDKHGS